MKLGILQHPSAGSLMQQGQKRWQDQNGILLWWTRLWAHQPGGTVPPERSPGTGQVWPKHAWNTVKSLTVVQGFHLALVFVCRSLMQGLDLLDSGAFDLSDWDQRLPPPAAKTAVQTLTIVIISPEQAGRLVWIKTKHSRKMLFFFPPDMSWIDYIRET